MPAAQPPALAKRAKRGSGGSGSGGVSEAPLTTASRPNRTGSVGGGQFPNFRRVGG